MTSHLINIIKKRHWIKRVIWGTAEFLSFRKKVTMRCSFTYACISQYLQLINTCIDLPHTVTHKVSRWIVWSSRPLKDITLKGYRNALCTKVCIPHMHAWAPQEILRTVCAGPVFHSFFTASRGPTQSVNEGIKETLVLIIFIS